MAGSSNPPPHDSAQKQEDLEYLNTRNANVSNFVSVQLSGEGNYHLWEKQMLCLLESYRIFQSIVDDDHPRSKQYDSLVKGWIFGSISEGLLGTVVDLGSAKKVWDELKSFYVPSPTLMSSKQEGYKDSPQIKSEDNGRVPTERKAEDRDVVSAEAETETEDNDVATSKARTKGGDVASIVDKEAVPNVINANDRDRIPTERNTEDRDVVSAEAEAENQTEDKDVVPSEAKTEGRDVTSTEDKEDTEVNAKGKYRIPSERKAEDRDVVSAEAETETEDTSKARTKGRDVASKKDKEAVPTDINAKGKDTFPTEYSIKVSKAIAEGRWGDLESTILRNTDRLKEKIDKDGNTVLHTVVRKGHNLLVEEILWYINGDDLCDMKTPSGSTALHIAAILDNREAANLLTKKNRGLLKIEDNDHKTPLDRAYQYMHLDIIAFLLKAGNDESTKTKKNSNPSAEIGVNVLIQAISAKYYDIATDLLNTFPHFAVENDNVLKTIAITFPSGLDYVETLIYPIMGDIRLILVEKAKEPFSLLVDCYRSMKDSWNTYRTMTEKIVFIVVIILFQIPLMTLLWIFVLISLLIWMVYFPSCIFYCNLWDVAARLGVPPIKHIVEKKWEWEKAKHVLNLVCNEIDKHKRTDYYNEPILEAARQNACEVVDEVLMRFPEAILYKDKSGYDIIQLAVIHRSEKIYNLIYIIGEHKNNYKTFKDSLKNNMLHLAGKLAPSHELKRSKGAAFQLQRELQWFEEVKKIVFPTYITDENIYKETPDMVFTREHENLVKEGEKWMRAVAESCSITASLIITIVFAAAITVPGGSNQETGLPLFTEDIAFTIFAISDAISLFASSTALLMFLSILTGRFAQQDFLVSLPRRMRIGLCTLMISTTAMMVAFGATMFIVFCGRKPWMLAPICVSAFLPIASFATLQVPLIVDLFRSSYVPIFGKKVSNTSYIFNKNRIMMLFGK